MGAQKSTEVTLTDQWMKSRVLLERAKKSVAGGVFGDN